MRNKIWYELTKMKFGEIYLSKYLSLQRKLKRTFNIITLLLSVSGILGWKFFENYAWIAFILICIMQLFTLVENQIIRSDKEIDQISELKLLYVRYCNKLEKLWYDFHNKKITEEESNSLFFQYRSDDWEKIEVLDGKLDIKQYNSMMNKTEIEALNYLKNYHYE